jgi:hypothetical protein
VSVRILIFGAPDEVQEAVKRQEQVLDVVGRSNPRKSTQKPGEVVVHIEAEVIDRG